MESKSELNLTMEQKIIPQAQLIHSLEQEKFTLQNKYDSLSDENMNLQARTRRQAIKIQQFQDKIREAKTKMREL